MLATLQLGAQPPRDAPLVTQFTTGLTALTGRCGVSALQASQYVVDGYAIMRRGGDTYADVLNSYITQVGSYHALTPVQCDQHVHHVLSAFLTELANPTYRAYCLRHGCAAYFRAS